MEITSITNKQVINEINTCLTTQEYHKMLWEVQTLWQGKVQELMIAQMLFNIFISMVLIFIIYKVSKNKIF